MLARAVYALYYAALATLPPFLVLYFRDLGFNGRQIGTLKSLPPLVSVVAAPLWGVLADATRRHRAARSVAFLGSWLAALGIVTVRGYPGMVAAMAMYAVFGSPVVSLVDSAVVRLLGASRSSYGQQRLWGAVGYGIAGLVAGALIDRYGLSVLFSVYLVLFALAAVASHAMPESGGEIPADGGVGRGAPEPAPPERTFRADLATLLRNPRWLGFLCVVFAGGLFHAAEMNYLMAFLADLGVSGTLMGVAILISTVAELPVWALAPRLLGRWGPKGLLALSLAASVVQALGYSLRPSTMAVLLLQLLHGLTLPAIWSACVAFAGDVAPEGTESTAVAMFSVTLMGLAVGLGAYVCGLLFDRLGGAVTFRYTAYASIVGLVLLATLNSGTGRVSRSEGDAQTGAGGG